MEGTRYYIKEWRRVRNLTQGELADASGLRRATISEHEHGLYEPREATIEGIAAALGVSVNQLRFNPFSRWERTDQ